MASRPRRRLGRLADILGRDADQLAEAENARYRETAA
jgi:hypothetical protein